MSYIFFLEQGGGILGGILCGNTTVCAVEINKYCRSLLLQRQRDGILPRFPIWDDVKTFDGKPWRRRVDIVCGGFPCQDISVAGKGAGITGERSGLWSEMSRIIGEIRPRYVLVENSPMLTTRGLGVVLADLSKMGYDSKWGVIGAYNAGAPHKRGRIWILANARCKHGESWNTTRMEAGAQIRTTSAIYTESSSQGSGEFSNPTTKRLEVSWAEQQTAGFTGICEKISNSDINDEQGIISECFNTERRNEQKKRPFGSHDYGSNWWTVEPGLGRMAHGVAYRVDRLKAIGNGQVPAVVELAWKTLNMEVIK